MKCSGQKSGCDRCRNLGCECVFVESRSGRVPGVRAKQTKQSEPVPNSVESSTSPDSFSVSNASEGPNQGQARFSAPGSLPVDFDLATSADNAFSDWPADMDFLVQGDILNNGEAFLGPFQNESITTASEFGRAQSLSFHPPVPNLAQTTGYSVLNQNDTARHESLSAMYNKRETQAFQNRTPPSISTHHTPPQGFVLNSCRASESDSNCIIKCIQIINTLENWISADLKPLDIILQSSRQTIEELDAVLSDQESSGNRRALTLCIVALSQVVELVENGCKSFFGDVHQKPQNKPIGGEQTSKIIFNLGDFVETPSEHRVRKAELVVQELQGCQRMLQKLACRLRKRAGTNEPNSLGEQLHFRLRDLIQYLKAM